MPSSKLLVFDVRDGWEPLCDFLGVPTPRDEFPNVNNATAVRRFMTAIRVGSRMLPVVGLYVSVRLLRRRLARPENRRNMELEARGLLRRRRHDTPGDDFGRTA